MISPEEQERAEAGAVRLDRGMLQSLGTLRHPGGGSLLARVVGLYLEHTPPQVTAVRSAVTAGDLATLKRAVHTLKSSSANVGARHLSGLCRDLEARLGEGWPVDAAERLAQIEAEHADVCAALRRVAAGEVV